MEWCVDERHGTPCPDLNDCCVDCDPAATVLADTAIEAAKNAGWSESYIESEIAAGRM